MSVAPGCRDESGQHVRRQAMTPAMPPASTVDAQVCAWLAAVLRDGTGPEPAVAAAAAAATAQVLAVASRHGVASLVHEHLRLHPGTPRPDWRKVVGSGMLVSISEGRLAEAKERLEACLSSSSD